MKKISFTLLLLFSTVLLSAQAPFPSKDEIKQFTASKTCVVLEDDPFSTYNAFITEAVKAYWKITPYEIISISDFNVKRLNPAYSFIVLTQTNFEKDKTNGPLSFAGEDDLDYSYKLGAILAFMQKHAQMISEDPSLTGRKYLKYYNKYIPDVQNKTILVKEEDLAPEIASIDRIKSIYDNKIEIVTEEDIVKAIDNKSANTVILHKVGPVGDRNSGYCFKMLIGTDDANMYYYNQHLIDKSNPNGLLPADLKRLDK